jgi:hypothetical protein
MSEDHIGELLKVNFVNIVALVVSISDFETSVRIFSCIAAGLYTIAKLVQTVQEIVEKRKEKNERPE